MDGPALPMRSLWFCFGLVVASCWSVFCLLDAHSGQLSRSSQEEAVTRFAGMDHEHSAGAVEAMTPHQRHTGPHMKWTALRPANPQDAQRAEEIVQVLRQALAKYKDYWVAMQDGFVPMHPERKPRHYHFANRERRFLAKVRVNPVEPTALLYRKTADGYEIEGAMYTAPMDMSEEQLNERIPLSVAQWHAHVNVCVAPDGSGRRITRRQFGFKGTIANESECRQAGGRFVPQAGGWMIHVYPFEITPAKIWTTH
jgi:hypothetical protein